MSSSIYQKIEKDQTSVSQIISGLLSSQLSKYSVILKLIKTIYKEIKKVHESYVAAKDTVNSPLFDNLNLMVLHNLRLILGNEIKNICSKSS